METGEEAVGGLFGDKTYQQRARRALPILVRQAKAGRPILYGELAAELGAENARTMNWPLGAIGNELLALGRRWNEAVPPIQALVVNKSDGLPGEGLSWFAPDAAEFRAATKSQRRQIVDMMLAKVYTYPRWDSVLREFGLEPLPALTASVPPLADVFSCGKGGESDRHRELKHLIAEHPELVGLPRSIGRAETEVMLYSADRIDVVFKSPRMVAAVEVKPEGAPVEDVVRGFFQCVKYQAVLMAQEALDQTGRDCRTVLALGGRLPPELDGLRLVLGFDVYQNVSRTR